MTVIELKAGEVILARGEEEIAPFIFVLLLGLLLVRPVRVVIGLIKLIHFVILPLATGLSLLRVEVSEEVIHCVVFARALGACQEPRHFSLKWIENLLLVICQLAGKSLD